MPSWPSSLPSLQVAGYTEQPDDGVVRTEMDAGPSFRRRRFTAVATRVTTTLVLTNAQVDTLLEFWRTTTQQGVAPFDIDDRSGDPVEAAFDAPPSISALDGVTYQAAIRLEFLP